jgi:hypothetical protein
MYYVWLVVKSLIVGVVLTYAIFTATDYFSNAVLKWYEYPGGYPLAGILALAIASATAAFLDERRIAKQNQKPS